MAWGNVMATSEPYAVRLMYPDQPVLYPFRVTVWEKQFTLLDGLLPRAQTPPVRAPGPSPMPYGSGMHVRRICEQVLMSMPPLLAQQPAFAGESGTPGIATAAYEFACAECAATMIPRPESAARAAAIL
jgi:hypothetical protein